MSNNTNPVAIELVEKSDNIDWKELSRNPTAIELLIGINQSLINKPNVLNWAYLSENSAPKAIELLKQNKDRIDWDRLAYNDNPAAIELLKEYRDIIYLKSLSYNIDPAVIELLEKCEYNINVHIHKQLSVEAPESIELLRETIRLDTNKLSILTLNPAPVVIELLKENINYLDWDFLAQNTNPEAIELLITASINNPNYNYNYWDYLSRNPAAIELLKMNQDKINWNNLSGNPAIFKNLDIIKSNKMQEFYDNYINLYSYTNNCKDL